jgi:hypothetical protein
MPLDRKFLLIAASFVLTLIVAGMFYTGTRLSVLVAASENWQTRSAFIDALERGEKQLNPAQATQLVRVALEAEHRRTEAITAARELVAILSWMGLAACALLIYAVRGVPRTKPLIGKALFGSASPAP